MLHKPVAIEHFKHNHFDCPHMHSTLIMSVVVAVSRERDKGVNGRVKGHADSPVLAFRVSS